MDDNMDNRNEVLEKVRYSDEELQEFKEIILKKLEKARDDYEQLRSAITHNTSNDTEDTSPTFKVLEEGASALSKEESTYGICRETGKLIPKERLKLVPHATLSIEAKLNSKKK